MATWALHLNGSGGGGGGGGGSSARGQGGSRAGAGRTPCVESNVDSYYRYFPQTAAVAALAVLLGCGPADLVHSALREIPKDRTLAEVSDASDDVVFVVYSICDIILHHVVVMVAMVMMMVAVVMVAVVMVVVAAMVMMVVAVVAAAAAAAAVVVVAVGIVAGNVFKQ